MIFLFKIFSRNCSIRLNVFNQECISKQLLNLQLLEVDIIRTFLCLLSCLLTLGQYMIIIIILYFYRTSFKIAALIWELFPIIYKNIFQKCLHFGDQNSGCVCEIFGLVAELWLHYDMSSLIHVDLCVCFLLLLLFKIVY